MGYIRRQLKTRWGRRVALLLVLLSILWIASRCDNTIKPPALVYLPDGNISEQFQALRQQELDLSMSDFANANATLPMRSGWIRFNPFYPLEPIQIAKRLVNAQREPTRRVVMYSGETLHLFIGRLASQTQLPRSKLLNAYYDFSPYADGGILAGFYSIPYKITPEAAMYYMTHRSEQAFRAIATKHHIPYRIPTFKNYLIVASIIQKETWHAEEMPHIASVIYNRLQRNMKLQLDATLNYGPYAHTPVTPERIRTDASAFNTYKHTGLPPEPIGSVSRAALHAAMQPAQTNDLYFVRNPKGWHTFSKTYAEHLEKIRKYREPKAR